MISHKKAQNAQKLKAYLTSADLPKFQFLPLQGGGQEGDG